MKRNLRKKVLVVAFDGLDKELIERYDLENIPQEEFGYIDNHSNIYSIKTGELFTTFITGKTYDKHMAKGLDKLDSKFFNFLNSSMWDSLKSKVRGFSLIERVVRAIFDLQNSHYTKNNLEERTLFDKISSSEALYVPGYNPDPHWMNGEPHAFFTFLNQTEALKLARQNTRDRLNNGIGSQPSFFSVELEQYDFLMLHLHDPDAIQDVGVENLEEEYRRLDEVAGDIKEEAENKFDHIIFMSDHGLPERTAHNTNAFYSCNQELFGDKIPHISDFHDKILEIVDVNVLKKDIDF